MPGKTFQIELSECELQTLASIAATMGIQPDSLLQRIARAEIAVMTGEVRYRNRHSMDESYPLIRELLYAPCVAFGKPSGEAEEVEQEDLRRTISEEIRAEGLDLPAVNIAAYDVGRSASAFEILAVIAVGLGGVVALAGGIEKIDKAIPIIRKWARAIRRIVKRVDGVELSREAIKMLCIDDLVERKGVDVLPNVESMAATALAGQFFDTSWSVVDPFYVVIPDVERNISYLYAIRRDGDILHFAELPCFVTEMQREYLLGLTSSASSSHEHQTVANDKTLLSDEQSDEATGANEDEHPKAGA